MSRYLFCLTAVLFCFFANTGLAESTVPSDSRKTGDTQDELKAECLLSTVDGEGTQKLTTEGAVLNGYWGGDCSPVLRVVCTSARGEPTTMIILHSSKDATNALIPFGSHKYEITPVGQAKAGQLSLELLMVDGNRPGNPAGLLTVKEFDQKHFKADIVIQFNSRGKNTSLQGNIEVDCEKASLMCSQACQTTP